MRWPWTQGGAPDPSTRQLRDAVDAIDALDPDTLEVIQLDADGRLLGPPRTPTEDGLREVAEHPSGRDPTGMAGIWEALGHGRG